MTLKPGAEAERRQTEHEAWQILRRKQGYVTHRVYHQVDAPLQRLVYSEWESKKAVDGARQHLQGTPLMRRARSTLAAGLQRLVVDIVGPVTSTKGLELPEAAIAVTLMGRLTQPDGTWQSREAELWKLLSSRPAHITHVLFRGADDPLFVGSLSHWNDGAAFEAALAQVNTLGKEALPRDFAAVHYKPVRD